MHQNFLPRGIRNNNPGNIRLSTEIWQGAYDLKNNKDPAFVTFKTPVMGLRALMRVLLTYHLKYKLDTIESIINRWAPPHENPTAHYILHVCQEMHLGRRQKISLLEEAVLIDLARVIVVHENGFPPPDMPDGWYLPKLYKDAAQRAFSTVKQG